METALENMAKEMDVNGATSKEITHAGYVMGAMQSMLVNDTEAFNHFMLKLAKNYNLKYNPI